MPIDRLDKFSQQLARVICQQFMLQQAQALLHEGSTSCEFLSALVQQKYFVDAISFVAHGLPQREAIWWSCVCVKALCSDLVPLEKAALAAVEAWVMEPDEDKRRATESFNAQLNYLSPAAWAAQAVFWSGGSIVAKEIAPVIPGAHLAAHAVNGAIQLAVTQQPSAMAERYADCVVRGVHIANGGNGQVQQVV